jgi:hypothetical protein
MNAKKTCKPSRLTYVVDNIDRLPKPLRKLASVLLIPIVLAYFCWIRFRLWLLDEFQVTTIWLKVLLIMVLSYAAVVAIVHR